MIIPDKRRYIGREVPGSERWEPHMERFTLDAVTGMDPESFWGQVEGLGSEERYRNWVQAYARNDGTFLSTHAWGCDRDLGEGRYLWGAMDDRHLSNLERVTRPGALDVDLHIAGKQVCVIGCWSGDENLLLHALGATTVDGIEEVEVYADMASLQLAAFDVPGRIWPVSLYSLPIEEMAGKYDLVYMPGVMYHLTDPVAALAICWALLRPGGVLAFESVVWPGTEPEARYLGAVQQGWNWWAPTSETYRRMLVDCGFSDGREVECELRRGWWLGTRGPQLPLLETGAAGFSRPDLLPRIRSILAGAPR